MSSNIFQESFIDNVSAIETLNGVNAHLGPLENWRDPEEFLTRLPFREDLAMEHRTAQYVKATINLIHPRILNSSPNFLGRAHSEAKHSDWRCMLTQMAKTIESFPNNFDEKGTKRFLHGQFIIL